MARSRRIRVSLIEKYLDGDLSDINTATIREDKLIELIESGRLKLKEGIDLDTQVFSEMIYNALQNDRLMKLGDEVMEMDFDDLDLDSILNQEPEAELDEDVKVEKTEIPEDVKDEQHEIQEENISSNETKIQNEEETNNEILTNEEEKEGPKVEEVGSMDEEKKVKAIRISGASIEISDEELTNAGINMNLDEFADSRIVKDVAARAVSKEQFLNNLKDRINENSFEVNGEKILSYGSRLTHEQLEEIASNSKSREEFDRNIKDVSEHTLHLTGKADRRSDAMDTTSFEDAFAYAEYSTKNVYIVVRKNGEEVALNISELQDKVTAKQLEDLLHESKSLEEYKNKINELVEKSRETILEAENIISEEPKKEEEAAPVVEETIPEEPKKEEEAAPVVEETIPEEPKKEEAKPVHMLLDDLMISMGIEEVIDSESISNDKENSIIKMAMKLRYKGRDLELDLDKYKAATNEEKLKMLKEACGEIDEELEKEKETEITKNYMTIKDLVNMSVDYYNQLGGKGFNTFILNGIDINIAEFAKMKNEKGEVLSAEELKQTILNHCIGVIENTHGKSKEEREAYKESLEKKPEKKSEKKSEEKPEEKPAEEKPAEEKPVEEKPAEEKPAEEKPAEESKPAEEPKPVEEPKLEPISPEHEAEIIEKIKKVEEVCHGASKIMIERCLGSEKMAAQGSNSLYGRLIGRKEEPEEVVEQKQARFEKLFNELTNYNKCINILYDESSDKELRDEAIRYIDSLDNNEFLELVKFKSVATTISVLDELSNGTHFEKSFNGQETYRKHSDDLRRIDELRKQRPVVREYRDSLYSKENEEDISADELKVQRELAEKDLDNIDKEKEQIAFRMLAHKLSITRRRDMKEFEKEVSNSPYSLLARQEMPDGGRKSSKMPKYNIDDIEDAICNLGYAYENLTESELDAYKVAMIKSEEHDSPEVDEASIEDDDRGEI